MLTFDKSKLLIEMEAEKNKAEEKMIFLNYFLLNGH